MHDHLSEKASTLSQVMLFIYRQNAPRQIASVCNFRMQREKRYFILMLELLRYFRLRSRSLPGGQPNSIFSLPSTF